MNKDDFVYLENQDCYVLLTSRVTPVEKDEILNNQEIVKRLRELLKNSYCGREQYWCCECHPLERKIKKILGEKQ